MTREANSSIAVAEALFRRLQDLACRHGSSIEDIVQHAIELHYDDGLASARLRLLDRLARLEGGLGDAAQLQEQIAAEARWLRTRASLAQAQTIPTD